VSEDHLRLLQTPVDDFTSFLGRLQQAFRNDGAALFWDETYGGHGIHVFKPPLGGWDDDQWQSDGDLVDSLHQVLVFAFSGAPDAVVTEWGEEHGQGLGGAALERVELMRRLLPSLQAEWRNRLSGISPVLGDLQGQIVFAPGEGSIKAEIVLDSFRVSGGPRHRPGVTSRQWTSFAVTRRDLARVIDALERIRELLPSQEEVEEDIEAESVGDGDGI